MRLPLDLSTRVAAVHRLLAETGARHCCYLCKRRVRSFLPYRSGARGRSPVAQALEVIGSDVDNFYCPRCGCHDRERHLAMYFDRLGYWRRVTGADVLHFAPEAHIVPKIVASRPRSYTRADLLAASGDVQRMDVTAIPLETASIDLLICNHVLEHVLDDARALAEIARVLRPRGVAVLQTPWSPVLSQSFSDPAIVSDALRARLFGQEDHVRVYGSDLFDRIAAAGLKVRRHRHSDLLHDLEPSYFGVNVSEELIVGEKAVDGLVT
jgi:SAM-dependent methyltransferase